MSNFGSRQLGFFTSKGSGGSASYQNLQQTLDFGNVTNNDLIFSQNDINYFVKFFKDSFGVFDPTYQVLSQANYTSVTKVVGTGEFTQLSTTNTNINMGSVDIGNTLLFLNQPTLNVDMTLPKDSGTLGIRSMLFKSIDLSSGDVEIGDSGVGTEVFFNKIFYVTDGSNTFNLILLDSSPDIIEGVPFYIVFANTDGFKVTIITQSGNPIQPAVGGTQALPDVGNGFLTLVKIGGQFWCNGIT